MIMTCEQRLEGSKRIKLVNIYGKNILSRENNKSKDPKLGECFLIC